MKKQGSFLRADPCFVVCLWLGGFVLVGLDCRQKWYINNPFGGGAILPADVQARGDIVAGGGAECFCQAVRGGLVFLSGGRKRSDWFYLVRRERRRDGRKASSLACGRVAAPLIAIWLSVVREAPLIAIWLSVVREVILLGGWGGMAGSILCDGSGERTAEKRHRWRAGGLPRR